VSYISALISLDSMRTRNWALIFLTTLMLFSCISVYGASERIEGYITTVEGEPLEGAYVIITQWRSQLVERTDENGYYSITPTRSSGTLYVYYDDPETPGYDYVPEKVLSAPSKAPAVMNFTLSPGATMILKGQLRIIENNKDIPSYYFKLNYDLNKSVVNPSIIYGKLNNDDIEILDLDKSTIIVNADITFNISVEPYKQVKTRSWQQFEYEPFESIDVSTEGGFILGQGEILELELGKYSLVNDFEAVESAIHSSEEHIKEVESQGYYMSQENSLLTRAWDYHNIAQVKWTQERYDECYLDLRNAFLNTVNIENKLGSFLIEAAFSVNLILVFAAFASNALAVLITEKNSLRYGLTLLIYTVTAIFLNIVFPGTNNVTLTDQILVSIVSLLTVFIIPKLQFVGLNKIRVGEIGFIDVLHSVFSMAKRNLRRRKTRTLLASATLLTLTMGFVSLTSLSQSYGLAYTQTFRKSIGTEGITVRMPEYTKHTILLDPETMDTWKPIDAGFFHPVDDETLEWLSINEDIAFIESKAENLPCNNPYTRIGSTRIYGLIGFTPGSTMDRVNEIVTRGESLKDPDNCLVHESLIESGSILIGEYITLKQRLQGSSRASSNHGASNEQITLRVVGAFGDELETMRDLDGSYLVPMKDDVERRGDTAPFIYIFHPVQCSVDEVIVTTHETARRLTDVATSRLNVEVKEGVDLELLGRSLAMSRELRFWVNDGLNVFFAQMGELYSGKGLSLVVPWGIVVLNVVVTMMNTMYERRKEIDILSSIGLNPTHISGVFISEALILGSIAGGFGYIIGLGVYPLMSFISNAPVVEMKVSAAWSVASVGISIVSVLVGSVISLRSSASLTPSLHIRYKLDESIKDHSGIWEVPVPAKIEEHQVLKFLSFAKSYLLKYKDPLKSPFVGFVVIKTKEEENGIVYELRYSFSQTGSHVDHRYTVNSLMMEPTEDNLYTARFLSQGELDGSQFSIAFIRKLIIAWSTIPDPDALQDIDLNII